MQITDVRVRLLSWSNKMRGIASITIDEVFVVHDIKIIEGDDGLFIAMPSRKSTDGLFRDIAHPINSETRDTIQRMVIKKYEAVLLEQDDED